MLLYFNATIHLETALRSRTGDVLEAVLRIRDESLTVADTTTIWAALRI